MRAAYVNVRGQNNILRVWKRGPARISLIPFCALVGIMTGCNLGAGSESIDKSEGFLIAHRGASAYAPEHTLAAYELAIMQGADFVEPDLQITRDGHIIALHDATLDRTTNVEEIFPDRFREIQEGDSLTRRWYVSDFTLEEIRTLDAGKWFSSEFKEERVPTLGEVIELVRGRAGIYPETKNPEVYAGLGYEMESLLITELEQYGIDRRGEDPATPVEIQSFSVESLRILRDELGSDLPLMLLIHPGNVDEWATVSGLDRASKFASGIGPHKSLLKQDPDMVERAHTAGLTVISWTFGETDRDGYEELREEMIYFLCVLGVDGLFTNNPDLFPSSGSCEL